MADNQPKLLLNSANQKPLDGPVFEPRLGWGFYVKRWLKKYFLKIIVPVAIIIITVGVFTTRKGTENGRETTTANKTVKITVLRGDGPVLAARRALAEYLKSSPEELTAGQKIFIEEILRGKIGGQKLVVGEEVSFNLNNIKEAISQSKNLSSYQLQVWEGYAKKAKLE